MSRCSVIDMASHADPIVDKLGQNGVTTVFRYYASGPQESLPEKRLKPAECNVLLAAGFSLGIVYQFNNNVLTSMTKARGRADAEFSLDYARNSINQPTGTAIYFGVDGDWYTSDDQKKVAKYFEGVNEVFETAGRPFRIGVYGSGSTCRNLRNANLAALFWLPLSTGWSGTRDFYNGGGWTFYQNFHGLRIGGRYIDTNVVSPSVTDIGTFNKDGPVSDVHQPSSVVDSRRFVKTPDLRLRSGPGTDHPEIGRLRMRQNLHVLDEDGGWSHVDINEDGIADGYCSSSHLVSFGTMP